MGEGEAGFMQKLVRGLFIAFNILFCVSNIPIYLYVIMGELKQFVVLAIHNFTTLVDGAVGALL